MSINIKAYDVTGGWSLDDYDLQNGHLVKFSVESKGIKLDTSLIISLRIGIPYCPLIIGGKDIVVV